MNNQAKEFWCPNCLRRFQKDYAILTLTARIGISGEGVNWSGDLEKDILKAKRVMYCKACYGPLDFHALLRGHLDYRCYAASASFLALVLTVAACLWLGFTLWATVALALIAAIAIGILADKLEMRRVARWRLSKSDVLKLESQ